jgi:hypothetical protein
VVARRGIAQSDVESSEFGVAVSLSLDRVQEVAVGVSKENDLHALPVHRLARE